VIAQVITNITGATTDFGFKGVLNGKPSNKNQIPAYSFKPKENTHSGRIKIKPRAKIFGESCLWFDYNPQDIKRTLDSLNCFRRLCKD